ncbi:MAG: aminopeptidase P family N-terminal domain-containing protein, partial [Actinomycetes bacterium]
MAASAAGMVAEAVPVPDYGLRRSRLRRSSEAGAEGGGVLITSAADVTWLTGFTGSNGAVLLCEGQVVLATDSRYREQARDQCPDVELLIERDVSAALLAAADAIGVRRLVFSDDDVSVAQLQRWSEDCDLTFV